MKKPPSFNVLFVASLFLLLGSVSWGTAAAADATTLLILGDSISAGYGIQRRLGWVELLKRRLRQQHPAMTVINASVSGDTTQGGITRLPLLLSTHQPGIVLIELGGNDGLRGYPTARIEHNLETLVALARGSGARVILAGMYIPPNYGPRYSAAFHAAFINVAEKQQTPLIPFLLEDVARMPELMQNDGIHPTAAAQPLLLKTAWPYIKQLLN